MPTFNSNDYYVTIGGVDISARVKQVSLEPTVNTVDTTSGSGKDWEEHSEGLRRFNISIELAYDDAQIATDLPQALGVKRVVYGPDTNASGKPKHEQDFVLTAAPFGQDVAKMQSVFAIAGQSTGAPVSNLYDNDVFS